MIHCISFKTNIRISKIILDYKYLLNNQAFERVVTVRMLLKRTSMITITTTKLSKEKCL